MNKATLKVLNSISREIDVIANSMTQNLTKEDSDLMTQRLLTQSRRLANLVITWDVILAKRSDRKGPNELE